MIKSYSYGDSEWKDLLTSFNGHAITYDVIGNPLAYRNGMTFTWQNGRQLSGISKDEAALASYTYNADGLRTSKTVNGVTTEYYWLNGTLQGQKTGEEYLFFLYDESGRAYGFVRKNGTQERIYYYEFNVQGDIIGIIDRTGTKVVEYSYGAWGDLLSVSGTLADMIGQRNPLRYRGYYYDTETGFYYLTSRYYDAETGRFVNADGYVSTGQDLNGFNMFSYCGNNPINRADPTGHFWSSILKFVKTAIVEIGKAIAVKAPAYAGAGGATFVDGPLPITDTIAAIGALAITADAIVNGVNQAVKVRTAAREEERAKVVARTKTTSPTLIYRYGKTNPGNLTPKPKDALTGLSFSLTPPPPGVPAAVTTIEALNATGKLIAFQDTPNHVSVIPAPHMGTLQNWIDTGSSHPCTAAVRSAVIKWDGGY